MIKIRTMITIMNKNGELGGSAQLCCLIKEVVETNITTTKKKAGRTCSQTPGSGWTSAR